MKKLFIIIATGIITASAFAQSPEKMSYQAVIRDASNDLVTNQAVGMQISILQGSSGGSAVYVETHTTASNANGLVSIKIGDGSAVSGTFTTIDWGNGQYFIKTETDPTGGTNYSITGTSQLLSVPYALHAKTAETIMGTITETDPVFGESVANGIAETDTTYWNNKLDSYTETDPIFEASVANGITAGDTANWNDDAVLDSTAIADLGFSTDTLVDGVDVGDVLVWDGTSWVPDNDLITITDENVIMNNSFSLSNGFYLAYFTSNNLSFVNDHSYIQVFPNSTATNRPVTLPDGETTGQTLVLACHWNTGSNGFRLFSSGNIKLNGGGFIDLYPNDTISLIWNSQFWTETSRSNN